MSARTISVIIPVYNVEKYLEACLQSVLDQTLLPLEIILVDDGSKDNSGALCDKLAEKSPIVRVIHQPNGGLSAARNTGIEAAKGDYVLFLDSDDTVTPDTVEKFTTALGDRDADVIVGNLRVVHPDEQHDQMHTLTDSSKMITGKEFLKTERKKQTMFAAAVQNVCSRAFLNEKNIRFVPRLVHEDEVFTPTLLVNAERVIPTDIVFYNHMIRENSITTQTNKLPNAVGIITVCRLTEKLTDNLADAELKNLMLDHAVDLYYKVFVDADLIRHPDTQLDKEYLKKYSFSRKNKLRTSLYCLSRKLFDFVEKKRRKAKGY